MELTSASLTSLQPTVIKSGNAVEFVLPLRDAKPTLGTALKEALVG
jgi:hypothetical protein